MIHLHTPTVNMRLGLTHFYSLNQKGKQTKTKVRKRNMSYYLWPYESACVLRFSLCLTHYLHESIRKLIKNPSEKSQNRVYFIIFQSIWVLQTFTNTKLSYRIPTLQCFIFLGFFIIDFYEWEWNVSFRRSPFLQLLISLQDNFLCCCVFDFVDNYLITTALQNYIYLFTHLINMISH